MATSINYMFREHIQATDEASNPNNVDDDTSIETGHLQEETELEKRRPATTKRESKRQSQSGMTWNVRWE